MKPIHCPESPRAAHCRQRVKSPKKFAPGSLRTIASVGRIKLVVGCPRGKYRRGKCAVGTKLQSILYPSDSRTCRRACAK